MILFTHSISPRLQFIADFIGKEIAGEPFHITTDIEEYCQYSNSKINYSNQPLAATELWIKPHTLLFETGIQTHTITCFETNGLKAFFKTTGAFSFDIFAASFYLLSRYEEYLPHTKDMYGRYAHINSLAFKEGFLEQPLVNKWIILLKDKLKELFPSFSFKHSSFQFLPTYDIDEAWSYKHKQAIRTIGAVAKAIIKGDWHRLNERRKVLKGRLQDPYDSFAWMDALHRQYQLKPYYFFLLPAKTGKYDRNILPDKPALQQLIRQHEQQYPVGIHPSWQTGDKPELIQNEIDLLQNITGTTIISSRQHFIRFTLPHTFRLLIDAGIKEDFSMGYGSINGFRASVASAFYWYDLEKEIQTDLLLYPFCFMDANSYFEQEFTPQQALQEMIHYYKEVKAVNGLLITLWHNTFLGTEKRFAGWRDVYVQFLNDFFKPVSS